MTHAIVYLGNWDRNIDRLKAHSGHVSTFVREDEAGELVPAIPPSKKVDGIVFGFLEKGRQNLPLAERFFAVAVADIVLAVPVKLIQDRHTDGKGFMPSPTHFGDNAAKALLKDIIAQNESQAARLSAVYSEFFDT